LMSALREMLAGLRMTEFAALLTAGDRARAGFGRRPTLDCTIGAGRRSPALSGADIAHV
jgi:hypothetical protein